jgi:hypothetical protein
VSRLSRQCEILNISQPYRPPRPVTGTALLLRLMENLSRRRLNTLLVFQRPLKRQPSIAVRHKRNMYMEGRRNKDGNGIGHSGLALRAFHAITKV